MNSSGAGVLRDRLSQADRVAVAGLSDEFLRVRARSLEICAPLAADDYGVQPMDDASPPKWHLAHTSWFFETFLLKELEADFQPFHPRFEYLFNSYYNAVGAQYPRAQRGLMSRPTLDEVFAYRRNVDDRMMRVLTDEPGKLVDRVILGLNHEQQHQELMLTDLKYNLGNNPLLPAYRWDLVEVGHPAPAPQTWIDVGGGDQPIGHAGTQGTFCFDNELPRHAVRLADFRLASRAVTNGEFLEFINHGGYANPALWLSDGWSCVQQNNWGAPLYWREQDGQWTHYTLGGERPIDLHAPVCHVSFYEADAYARWRGARLPSEFEWEAAAASVAVDGNLFEHHSLHPMPAAPGSTQFFGDVWEWTATPYQAYPGFSASSGALGEYNGKFMCNQMVLRGGSALTARDHVRASYRNFFYPPDRWQMSGIRLASLDG